MPEMIIKNIVRKVDIFPLNPEQHRTLGILSLNPDFLSPASAVMVAHIKNMLKEGKI